MVVGHKTNQALIEVTGQGALKVADNMAAMAEYLGEEGIRGRQLFYLLGDNADSLL